MKTKVTSTLDSSLLEPRSGEEQMLLSEAITTLFEHKISFNEFLGFKIVQRDPLPVLIRFEMRPELVGHFLYGRLHGGVISSVLDVVGGLAVFQGIANFHAHESCDEIMQRFAPLSTIDMRVDYLRQGIGQTFTAEANVVRLGRRVAVCSMRLSNEENILIATGSATYMVS
ncbi:MAG: hypothetical protein ACI8VW_002223 [bacterium]